MLRALLFYQQETASMTFEYTRLPQEEDVHPTITHRAHIHIASSPSVTETSTPALSLHKTSKFSVLYLVGFTNKSRQDVWLSYIHNILNYSHAECINHNA
jgi:hypothetical protein